MVINQADDDYQWLRAAMKFAQENELAGEGESAIAVFRFKYNEGCYRECRGLGLVNMVIKNVSVDQKFDVANHPKQELCTEHAIFDKVSCKTITSGEAWTGHLLTGGLQTQLEVSHKNGFLAACKHIMWNDDADMLGKQVEERHTQAIIKLLEAEGRIAPTPNEGSMPPKKKHTQKSKKKVAFAPNADKQVTDSGLFLGPADTSAAKAKPGNETILLVLWFSILLV
jgi:hypothetical protein